MDPIYLPTQETSTEPRQLSGMDSETGVSRSPCCRGQRRQDTKQEPEAGLCSCSQVQRAQLSLWSVNPPNPQFRRFENFKTSV